MADGGPSCPSPTITLWVAHMYACVVLVRELPPLAWSDGLDRIAYNHIGHPDYIDPLWYRCVVCTLSGLLREGPAGMEFSEEASEAILAAISAFYDVESHVYVYLSVRKTLVEVGFDFPQPLPGTSEESCGP